MSSFEVNSFDFNVNENKLKEYFTNVLDFGYSNGLLCLSKQDNDDPNKLDKLRNTARAIAVTLFPTKFPAKEYQYALDIQKDYNELVFSISNDHEFLSETLKNIIKVDDFTRRLWNIYEKVREEGISQPISLAILRNDFMLDQNKVNNPRTALSQIEINTVSCSFGAATSTLEKLHKYTLNFTNNEQFLDKHVQNNNIDTLARGIIKAWELYNNPKAKVVFLVAGDERNIGDQRKLEFRCLELNSKLRIIRYTFEDISKHGKLDDNKNLIVDNDEIALVYYRQGYDPDHYFGERDWDARLLIERSRAIKCPNIQQHLTGAKIIQQALSEPNALERFIKDKEVVERIRATFVDLHAINEKTIENVLEIIDKNSQDYVLKPQREGGGNNIYKEDIKNFIGSLKNKNDLMGYILMKLVKPYLNQNYIVRPELNFKKEKLISEIGIYGVYISNSDSLLINETGGYLLRTKSYEINEGGVATGYSALDSIYLV